MLLSPPAAFPHYHDNLATQGGFASVIGANASATLNLVFPVLGSKSFTFGGTIMVPSGGATASILLEVRDKEAMYASAGGTIWALNALLANSIVFPGGATSPFFVTLNAETEGYFFIGDGSGGVLQEATIPLRYGAAYGLRPVFFNSAGSAQSITVGNVTAYLR